MLKKMKRWIVILAASGPVIYGASCSTQLRDAAAAGVFDFVTGTTTDTLSALAPISGLFAGAE